MPDLQEKKKTAQKQLTKIRQQELLRVVRNLRPFHSSAEGFESAASFLQLDLPCTLIRHENGAFCKRSLNQRNLKSPAFRFSVDRKHFENDAFGK